MKSCFLGFLFLLFSDKIWEAEGISENASMFVHGFTFSITVLLGSALCDSTHLVGGGRRITIFHLTMGFVVIYLLDCKLKEFVVKTFVLAEWILMPLLVLYCCKICNCRDVLV